MIEIQNLTRRFGNVVALDRISMNIPDGIVLGIVGPRGSGKSTLLKILASLIEPTSGDAVISGASITRDKVHARLAVGYLPDDFGVYPELTCAEYIEFFASCYGVPPQERVTLADDLLQLVDLSHRKDLPADRLTRGMRQRLGLARVLAHDPKVLLLDDLFVPLDPRARMETRELVRELSGMGKTILITGPGLAEMQDVCSHAAIMNAGRVERLGALDEITAVVPLSRKLTVKFLGDSALAARLLREGTGVVDVQHVINEQLPDDALSGIALLKELRVIFNGSYGDASALLRSLMHSGVQIVAFAEEG